MQCYNSCLMAELILLYSRSACILPCIALPFKTKCKSSFNILCAKITTAFCFVFSHSAEPPRITTHPQEVKDAVPGKLVTFSIEATGTKPLSYQWQYEAGSEGWHLYDVERSPGANSSTLTIPRVKKSNEGSYYCIVSNCAGSKTSKYATLSLCEYWFNTILVD